MGRRALAVITLAMLAVPALAQEQEKTQDSTNETPRRGGELVFVVQGEPSTYDCHAGGSFAISYYVMPHYSTLLKVDAAHYPDVVGDLADHWQVSPDGLTYTFTLRDNVHFHDGTLLTSADVKASYERLRAPPPGVVSVRKSRYVDISAIETPDARTVTFRLGKPNASMLSTFASPVGCIYSAARLKEDPNWPATHVMGTGAFSFVEHVKGSHWIGKRFDGYFRSGLPYLDGFKALSISGAGAINALSAGQALAEFRGVGGAERDRIKASRGNLVSFPESPATPSHTLTFNAQKPPFNDVRVRRALTLAIDRWGGLAALSKITDARWIGGAMRPGNPVALPDDELAKLPGFWRDAEASRAEARRLLKEAGVSDLKLTLTNRSVPMPYDAYGIYLIDQWRRIGVTADQVKLDNQAYFAALKQGSFDAVLDFSSADMDDPSEMLEKYVPSASINYAHAEDPELEHLFEQQKRAIDPTERTRIVQDFDRRAMSQAYVVPMPWSARTAVIDARLHGWHVSPSIQVGQDLTEVWLAQ
jgi:peptide/nickel transport system substrate-binding protein